MGSLQIYFGPVVTIFFIVGLMGAIVHKLMSNPQVQLMTGMDSMRQSVLGSLDCKKTLSQFPADKKRRASLCNRSLRLVGRDGAPVADIANGIGLWKFSGYCSPEGVNVEASLVETPMVLFQKLQHKHIKLFPDDATPCRTTPESALARGLTSTH